MYFHGTEFNRGQACLKKQKMEYSRSTKNKQHWLGDGIYLYKDKIYAFRWIVLMYQSNNLCEQEVIREELLKRYLILKLSIDYDSDRVFRLNNPEHLEVFMKVKDEYKKKSGYSKEICNTKYADGIILNIMFQKLDYNINYDLVEATFPIAQIDEVICSDSRFKTINEDQICIKNPGLVKIIEDITDTIDIDDYLEKYRKYESFNDKIKAVSKCNNNGYNSTGKKYSSNRKVSSYKGVI